MPQVLVNRQLTELVRDVPLDVDVAELERQAPSTEAVHEVFDALQFRILRDRLFESLEVQGPSLEEAQAVDVDSIEPGGWDRWTDGLTAPVAVALSGTWGAGTGRIDAIGIAGAGGGPGLVGGEEGRGDAVLPAVGGHGGRSWSRRVGGRRR